jgi:acyl dehydratase
MTLDSSFVGRTYPPTDPYEVGREKIREFADAIGDPNPVYRDPEAAKQLGHPDVIAPPTFTTILSMRALEQVIDDPALGLDYSRVVHGDQRFVHARPVYPGDRLVVVLTIESIQTRGSHDILSTRADISTIDGEPVVAAYSTLVARGTEPA